FDLLTLTTQADLFSVVDAGGYLHRQRFHGTVGAANGDLRLAASHGGVEGYRQLGAQILAASRLCLTAPSRASAGSAELVKNIAERVGVAAETLAKELAQVDVLERSAAGAWIESSTLARPTLAHRLKRAAVTVVLFPLGRIV